MSTKRIGLIESFYMILWTYKSVVQGRWEFLQVEPDVECAGRRDVYVKVELVQALEDVIAFRFEVLLQSNLFSSQLVKLWDAKGEWDLPSPLQPC